MLQPDDTVNVAVEKINSLLETFLGISDTELGEVYKNLQPVTTSIFGRVITRLHAAYDNKLMYFFIL